ncbi:MAG TPA: hypothetical protein PKH39_18535, partial [Woeseiaceae bacterium]|nr:hypothetical protein [Woeseiaceae bacterium]
MGIEAAAPQVRSLRFYDGIVQGDYEGRVRIALPAAGVGVNVSGDLTYEIWMAPSATPSDNPLSVSGGVNSNWIYSNIFLDRDTYEQLPMHGAGLSAGQVAFGIDTDQGRRTIVAGPEIRDGEMHFVVLQRTASTGQMDVFVDGVRVASETGPLGSIARPDGQTPANSCGPTLSGSCSFSDPYLVLGTEKHDISDNGYRGLISQIRVSNTVRYPGTSHSVPSTPMLNDANTVGLYNWSEGSGTSSADLSGLGQTADVRVDAQGPTWEPDTPYVTPVASLALTNTVGSARNGRVEMFGHAFKRGDVPAGQTLQARVDGSIVPIQVKRTATWPDGSLQYAVCAVVAGDFSGSQSKALTLLSGGSAAAGSNIALSDLPADGTSYADLTLGSETITCNRTNLLAAGGELTQVFTGPHCAHWIYRPTYPSAARVYARFDIYVFREGTSGAVDRVEYAGGNENIQIRIDEADHGTVSSSLNRFRVNGSNVLSETAPLYQYSRWWEHDFDMDIHVIHDVDYLSSSGVIWSYRSDFAVPGAAITAYASSYNAADGINETAGWRNDWSGGSTDPDIGPIPGQDVCYLVSQNATMRDTMLRMHQRWGRNQIHMFDEDQGRPAQVGPNAGQHNTGGLNMNPDFTNSGGRWGTFASAGYTTDVAHMPRGGFVPYLLTGRDWYREEMTFFANVCCANGNGAYVNSTDYNLLCADQIRAEGWSMCQVAVAAALNPDGDSMKAYFEGALSRHLNYTWGANFAPGAVTSGAFGYNQMGLVRNTPSIVGSGARFDSYWIPWQQDFMTLGSVWAWKLGYDGSPGSPVDYSEYSRWLCKNTVGKIHKFGFQSAALYWCALRNSTFDHQYWHTLREDVYEFTEANSGALRPDFNDSGALIPPGGSFGATDLAELQTGEPGSAAWRAAFYTDLGPTQSIGFSNERASDIMILWAAVAAAVDRGAEGASDARSQYITISNKPDTESGECEPQFDIEPTPGFPHRIEGPGPWITANVPTDSTWQNVTASLGRNLSIHDQATSYSGGGAGGGFCYV